MSPTRVPTPKWQKAQMTFPAPSSTSGADPGGRIDGVRQRDAELGAQLPEARPGRDRGADADHRGVEAALGEVLPSCCVRPRRAPRRPPAPPARVVVDDRDGVLGRVGREDVDHLGRSKPGSDQRDPLHAARERRGAWEAPAGARRLCGGGLHHLHRDQLPGRAATPGRRPARRRAGSRAPSRARRWTTQAAAAGRRGQPGGVLLERLGRSRTGTRAGWRGRSDRPPRRTAAGSRTPAPRPPAPTCSSRPRPRAHRRSRASGRARARP